MGCSRVTEHLMTNEPRMTEAIEDMTNTVSLCFGPDGREASSALFLLRLNQPVFLCARASLGLLRIRELAPANQRAASPGRRATMAEGIKPDGRRAPPDEASRMSSYSECVCAMLGLLADFAREVRPTTCSESVPFPVGADR